MSTAVTTPIVLDVPSTWPRAVMDWAGGYAEGLRGSTPVTSDLLVPLEEEDDLRSLLGGPLLAYHCTRLLNHEVSAIRGQGLRMLSRELIEERIAEAHRRDDLSDGQCAHLRACNVYAINEQRGRERQVCLVLGRTMFDEPHWCEPLLTAWGGEGMNGGPLDPTVHLTIGRPTIVVAQIDLTVSHTVSPSYPALGKLFVGTLLETEHRFADVFLRASVPREDILDIWQPGHAEYDRHSRLPR